MSNLLAALRKIAEIGPGGEWPASEAYEAWSYCCEIARAALAEAESVATPDDLMDELTDAVADAINSAEGWPKQEHLRTAMQRHGLRVVRA